MTVALVIGLVVIVALVVVALSYQQRVASQSHGVHTGKNDPDAETQSYRDHPPGGGTGGL